MAAKIACGFAVWLVSVIADKACYSVTQTSEKWTTDYATDLPTDPHYSGMTVAMHTSGYTMSAVGATATEGVKNVAEMGNSSQLQSEIQALAAGMAMTPMTISTVSKSGANWRAFPEFVLEADSSFPFVSMITMIAPSPDWYAFGSAMLYENGAFQTKSVNLYAYDAGTDSGMTYTAANSVTSPQAQIMELMSGVTGPTVTGKRLMMTMTFTPTCCYTVRQTSEKWTTDYATDLPTDPHYSGMTVAMHTSGYTMSAVGGTATAGVKNVAEMGNPSMLKTEIQALASGMAMTPMTISTVSKSGADWRAFAEFRMKASSVHPHVSMITMIAPSPDWYAFGSAKLYENGAFQTKSVNLIAYDAGTDSGMTYTAANNATSPQGQIMELMSGVTGPSTAGPRTMMTMTFTPDAACVSMSPTMQTMQTCGDVKREYQAQRCCGMPSKAFMMPGSGSESTSGMMRRLSKDELLEDLKAALDQAKMQGGPSEAGSMANAVLDVAREYTKDLA